MKVKEMKYISLLWRVTVINTRRIVRVKEKKHGTVEGKVSVSA